MREGGHLHALNCVCLGLHHITCEKLRSRQERHQNLRSCLCVTKPWFDFRATKTRRETLDPLILVTNQDDQLEQRLTSWHRARYELVCLYVMSVSLLNLSRKILITIYAYVHVITKEVGNISSLFFAERDAQESASVVASLWRPIFYRWWVWPRLTLSIGPFSSNSYKTWCSLYSADSLK